MGLSTRHQLTEDTVDISMGRKPVDEHRNSPNISHGTPKAARRGWRFRAALGVICLLNLVAALDASIITVALPDIATELNGSGIQMFWVGTSFMLSATVFQPAFTSFSQLFGRKALILTALSLFTTGCIMAGWARNMTILLSGRTVQGVGGGGIMGLSSVLLADLFPLRERGKWAGVINIFWAVGSVSGPPLGGVLAQSGAWRWIFWVNLPFCGLGFPLIPLFITLQPVPGSIKSKLRSFDWAGLFLFSVSATSFLLGVTWGGVQFDWVSCPTLVPLAFGLAGLLLFAVYEMNVPDQPLIRFDIFSNSSVISATIGTILHGIIIFSVFYYAPLYTEAVHAFSPLLAAVALIPNTFTVAPGAAITGLLISKWGYFRWALWLGWILVTIGSGILLLLTKSSSKAEIMCIFMVLGLGLGVLVSSLIYSIQANSRPEDSVYCNALYSLLRMFGQTIGIAIGGAIFQNRIRLSLEQSHLPLLSSRAEELARQVSILVKEIQQAPAASPVRLTLISAFQSAFQTFVYVLCALGATGLLLSTIVKGHSLNQRFITNQNFQDRTLESDMNPPGDAP